MLVNIFSLTIVLSGMIYLSFYINKIWLTQRNYVTQRIISEDTDVSPKSKKSRQSSIKLGYLVLVYFAVLLGMLTTLVYRDMKEHGSLNYSKFRLDCLLSAIVSPLVLQAVLSSYPEITKHRWYSLFLNGYQNGFFWQTIFGELAGKL